MTRFVFLSDTHNLHEHVVVPDGDVLIHCGDATVYGKLDELASFAQWFEALPHRRKIFIPGNHDVVMQDNFKAGCEVIRGDIEIVTHGQLFIEGVQCFLSSWTPGSYHGSKRWRFHYDRQPVMTRWEAIPLATQLLVTHGPPLGILDKTGPKYGYASVGCSHLTGQVMKLVEHGRLSHHVFGHIHDSHGRLTMNVERDIGGPIMEFINTAICDDTYKPVFEPEVVDL